MLIPVLEKECFFSEGHTRRSIFTIIHYSQYTCDVLNIYCSFDYSLLAHERFHDDVIIYSQFQTMILWFILFTINVDIC